MNTAAYAKIGMMLAIEHPDISNKLSEKINDLACSDTWNLNDLLFKFCELRGIKTNEICGNKRSRKSTEHKMLFVGVVLKMYDPFALFIRKNTKCRLRASVSEVLGLTNNNSWYALDLIKKRITVDPIILKEIEYYTNRIKSLESNV